MREKIGNAITFKEFLLSTIGAIIIGWVGLTILFLAVGYLLKYIAIVIINLDL